MNSPKLALLEPNLGDEMVTIYVGPKRKKFICHKKLICDSANFFLNAFTGHFKERHNCIMYMSDDSSGGFCLYVEWLYHRTVPDDHTEDYLENLFELYFLADKLCLSVLKDLTMDQIQDISLKYDITDIMVEPARIKGVLENTSTFDGLQRYIVYLIDYLFMEQRNEDKDLDEGDKRFLTGEPTKLNWEVSKDHFAFFSAFFNQSSSGGH